ncbi:S-adenosyl-L-methionine-dependent methyltransferase [Backusella circina FSU 941]|nr:S-adenosyl-L-methionine-dependent methyltransferase [Backusella circina FSU 941]
MYNDNEISVTMRVMCHGFVPTTDMDTLFTPEMNKKDEESEPITPSKIIKSIGLISQTRSNNSQYVSTLDLDLVTPLFNSSLRRLFYFHSKYPIIGNSTFTKPLRVNSDKGLCASLIDMSLKHPITEALVHIQESEPEKFSVMREREEKFYQRKLKQESEEIAKATAIDLSERKDGQLLAYLLGQKDFCGLTYKITSDCLIPRTSSETLVHAATQFLSNCISPRVVDVGTGCGNLLISILSKVEGASGLGIDINPAALQVAKTNSETHQVINRAVWKLQDMATLDKDDEKYHVLVCNPPYLDFHKTNKKKPQMACLSQEPAQALFANEEGYEFYNVLSRVAPSIVENDGRVILECGKGMMARVLDIWSDHWEPETIIKDVQRWDRCVVLKRKGVKLLSQL